MQQNILSIIEDGFRNVFKEELKIALTEHEKRKKSLKEEPVPIKDVIAHFGIDRSSWWRWEKTHDFSDATVLYGGRKRYYIKEIEKILNANKTRGHDTK